MVQVDHPVQGEHSPLGRSAAMLRAGIQMQLLPVGQRSCCSSCPLSSGPGRSGALGKLLEFRAMIIPFQYPVRDQRESSDLTWGGPSTPGGVTWALLGGLIQVTPPPSPQAKRWKTRQRAWGKKSKWVRWAWGPATAIPGSSPGFPLVHFCHSCCICKMGTERGEGN